MAMTIRGGRVIARSPQQGEAEQPMALTRAEIAARCGVAFDDVRAVYEFTDRVCAVTHDGVKHWGPLLAPEVADAPEAQEADESATGADDDADSDGDGDGETTDADSDGATPEPPEPPAAEKPRNRRR